MTTTSLGADLRALRKSRRMTLQSLADDLGKSVGWRSQIERDLSTPDPRDLAAMADREVRLKDGRIDAIIEHGKKRKKPAAKNGSGAGNGRAAKASSKKKAAKKKKALKKKLQPMKLSTLLKLAYAETRRSRGKLLFCVFSIAVGVGSLTAIRTTIVSLEDGIQELSLCTRSLQLALSFWFLENCEIGNRTSFHADL